MLHEEPAAAKRPALSGAFSAHVSQTALNRQLLAAQGQVTELQNSLLEKQGKIDRLEADILLVSNQAEQERQERVSLDLRTTLEIVCSLFPGEECLFIYIYCRRGYVKR